MNKKKVVPDPAIIMFAHLWQLYMMINNTDVIV